MKTIIQASSNPGDMVLDPFCGCGTTIDAAEKNGRDWIGIDVAQLAISLIMNRLQNIYGSQMKFIVGGTSFTSPTSNPTSPSVEKLGTRVTRPSEQTVVLVHIMSEPTSPNNAAAFLTA